MAPRVPKNGPNKLKNLGQFLAPLVPYLGHSWLGKLAKLISLDVLSTVSTLFQPNSQFVLVLRPILPVLLYVSQFLPPFATLWIMWANFFIILTWKKVPTWSCRLPPVVFQSFSTPSNPTSAPWAYLWSQKVIFSIFFPLFWALSGPYLDILGLANGPSWSALMSLPFSMFTWKKGPAWSGRMPPVVFKPCSTPSNQNRPKRLFSAYLGHFLAPLGPYLGHSGPG